MAHENIERIGSRIKKLRKQRQVTLKELSEYTGLSIGFLSSFEREVTSPSLQNLKIIAEALDTTITDLISDETPERTVIHKKETKVIDFPQYNMAVTYIDFGITPPIYEIITILPGQAAEQNEARHVYDECCTVISGQLTLHMGGEVYCLQEGDSIYIKKHVRHSLYNYGSKPCVSYWVYLRQH